jgi:hypothetical protein
MSKLDQAADRARARDAAKSDGTGETALTVQDQAALQTAEEAGMFATQHEVAARIAAGELEAAPQLSEKIPYGKTMHAFLEGYGPVAEFTKIDKRTGEVTVDVVNTWILRSLKGNARISILSSAQLDKKCPPFIGKEVYITSLGEIETKSGGRMDNYHVAGEKTEGRRMEWSTHEDPAAKRRAQLDASVNAAANSNGVHR